MWFDILKRTPKFVGEEIRNIQQLVNEIYYLSDEDYSKEINQLEEQNKNIEDKIKFLIEQRKPHLEQKKKLERRFQIGPKTKAKIAELDAIIKPINKNINSLQHKFRKHTLKIYGFKEDALRNKNLNDPVKLIQYAAKIGIDLKDEQNLNTFLRLAKIKGLDIEEMDFTMIMPQKGKDTVYHEQEEIPKDKIQMVVQMYRSKNNKFPPTTEIIEMLEDEYGIAPTRWDYRADEKLKEIYSGQVWKQILRD